MGKLNRQTKKLHAGTVGSLLSPSFLAGIALSIAFGCILVSCHGRSGQTSHTAGETNQPDTRIEVRSSDGSFYGYCQKVSDDKGDVFDVFIVDPVRTAIQINFRDETGQRIGSLKRLNEWMQSWRDELIFATNGGMYAASGEPVGLFVSESQVIHALNLRDAEDEGNFFLKPNGVFAITARGAFVVESTQYVSRSERERVVYATQSGPMLVADGTIHPKFEKESHNLNIRSGVGINDLNQAVFAISEREVNFYDFANLFVTSLKCRNALYLDGFVSRMYLPALERHDEDGDFAGIITVSKRRN